MSYCIRTQILSESVERDTIDKYAREEAYSRIFKKHKRKSICIFTHPILSDIFDGFDEYEGEEKRVVNKYGHKHEVAVRRCQMAWDTHVHI